MIVFAAVAMLGVFATTAVSAQTLEPTPDSIWDVDGTWVSGHTGSIRAMVWDFQELNGKVYVGGKFLEVVSAGRTTRIPQPFLAAFDRDSGAWVSTFTPQLDGAVYALDVRSDGKLLAAGEMTGGIVAVDPVSGAVDAAFNPQIENSWGRAAVFDIDVVGDEIYAGGSFRTSQGVELDRLAKLNAFSGDIDPNWTPKTDYDEGTARNAGELVWSLEADISRGRIYVTGKFGGIDGNLDAAYFAILDPETGEVRDDVPQGLPKGVLSHRLGDNGFSMWQHDVQLRGDTVFLGGQAHQTLIMDAATLTPRKSYFTNRGMGDEYAGGDTQVMYVGENTLWSGCHCWGSVGEYPLGSYVPMGQEMDFDIYKSFVVDFRDVNPFGQQPVRGAYGIDLETEELVPLTFDLLGQGGGWAMLEDSTGSLWVGGQFTQGGGSTRSGLVRFSAPIGDTDAVVEACEVSVVGDQLEITWDATGDPEAFIVRRSVNDGTVYWRGRISDGAGTFTDSNRSGVLKYFVEPRTGEISGEMVECGVDGPVTPGEPTPEGLTTTRIERTRIVLNWAESADVEIERDGEIVGTDSDRWYTDLDLAPGTSYSYRIRYQGTQTWSEAIQVMTLGTSPTGDIVAPVCSYSIAGGEVSVSWQELPNAQEVIVQREVNASGTWYWRGKVAAVDGAFSDTDRDGELVYRTKARYPNGDSEYTLCISN